MTLRIDWEPFRDQRERRVDTRGHHALSSYKSAARRAALQAGMTARCVVDSEEPYVLHIKFMERYDQHSRYQWG